MNRIFIDTNFIVAIFREIESRHELAVETCERLLGEYECCITNSIITEVVTIIMMRTKNLDLTRNAYYFMIDNFTVLNEYDIDRYNDKVFHVFEKYNANKFNLGFVDCSAVVLSQHYNMDFVVSFDKNFKLFDEIRLYEFWFFFHDLKKFICDMIITFILT